MRSAAALVACVLVAGCGGGGGGEAAPPIVSRADVVRAPGVQRERPQVAREAVAARAAADAAFGFALQRHLGVPGENLVWSPYSATHAFALAYAGARGETREQLAKAFNFPEDGDDLHPALNALDRAIEARAGKGVTIDTANSAWGQVAFPWERAFLETLARHHGAGMRAVDFVRDREGAAKALDEWVRTETRDKISDLFTADDFSEVTRLVLANAAYLKAKWLARFDPDATTDAPFHAPDGTVDVPTMHDDREMPFAEGDGWQAAEMPYRGERLAMVIILPARGALEDVERRLADGLLDDVRAGLAPAQIRIALPRFRIESKAELVPPLQALGVRDAFDDAADLSGMTRKERLFIAKARQKAFIAVDEHGTEAAAATGAVVNFVSKRPPPRPFVVDRPFLFVIHDRTTGAVLFSGRVTNPAPT
jgi:serpin B